MEILDIETATKSKDDDDDDDDDDKRVLSRCMSKYG